MFPDSNHYWLINTQIPASLLVSQDFPETVTRTRDNLVLVDLEIREGIIQNICSSLQNSNRGNLPDYDLQKGQVWPCFADIHTHLDKGHIWERTPNPNGSFLGALETILIAEEKWTAEDIYRRMEFGLKCSYAHGTQAIRTHLDSLGQQTELSWDAFRILREKWQDKIYLQAVSLVPLDYFLTPEGENLADQVAELGGILGGFAQSHPDLNQQLDRLFKLAQERGLDLDLHTDESLNPDDRGLRHIAQAAIRHEFSGQIVCGHCCSLSVQSLEESQKTLELVKQAKIAIVSLPMCNLYLQDRQANQTPRLRGVTLVQEMNNLGIPVCFASDNCRDPFYGFGDHDGLEVFTQSVRIAHLDMPYQDWACAVTSTPAELMRLSNPAKIGVGLPANLVLFKGRSYSELLARSQRDRIVLRNGKPIDTTLPDYRELDDLLQLPS